MARILMVIAPRDFRDSEYFEPKTILEANHHEVVTGSKVAGEARGIEAGITTVTARVQEVDPQNYNAIVFIGGNGMSDLVSDPEFTGLAEKFNKAGKITASICIATAILANAGILQGKKVTGWSGIKEAIEFSGGVYTGKPVEIDGNIITANGPDSAEKFGLALVEALNKA